MGFGIMNVLSLSRLLKYQYIAFFIYLILIFSEYPAYPVINDEERLIKKLLNGYDARIRPVNSSKMPTTVALGLSITEIVELVSWLFFYQST